MGLELQYNTYSAVLTIPKDVRKALGKSKFKKSLKTGDKQLALLKERVEVAKWKIEIARARGELIEELKVLYEEALRLAEVSPGHVLRTAKNPFTGALDVDEEGEPIMRKFYEESSEDESLSILKEHLKTSLPSKAYLDVTGEYTQEETAAYLAAFIKTLDCGEKWKDRQEALINRMVSQFPKLEDISKKTVRLWCDELLQELSPKTVQQSLLCACRNYWSYLQDIEVVPEDLQPFTGLRFKPVGKKKKTDWKPYTNEEITKVLKASHGYSKNLLLPDLIEIGRYTGMRINEICSRKLTDISETEINVPDSKTESGVRSIPIHSKLKPIIEKLIDISTDEYLLPGLSDKNKYKDRSVAIGKIFGRLKTSLGFTSRHGFHSIRSTVATQLENAGVPENVAADILGHEKPTMTYGLYSGGSNYETKKGAIEKIKYTKS